MKAAELSPPERRRRSSVLSGWYEDGRPVKRLALSLPKCPCFWGLGLSDFLTMSPYEVRRPTPCFAMTWV
jgi:hypothetical protein